MDACIRAEFGLSDHEYRCLMKTLHARFGVEHVEDLACLSPAELALSDRWETAALRRLVEIAVTQIGVEKLHRAHAADASPSVSGSRSPFEPRPGDSHV